MTRIKVTGYLTAEDEELNESTSSGLTTQAEEEIFDALAEVGFEDIDMQVETLDLDEA